MGACWGEEVREVQRAQVLKGFVRDEENPDLYSHSVRLLSTHSLRFPCLVDGARPSCFPDVP